MLSGTPVLLRLLLVLETPRERRPHFADSLQSRGFGYEGVYLALAICVQRRGLAY
jgi:hypothetical protein